MTKIELTKQYVQKYIDLALKHNTSYSKRYIATVMFNDNPDIFKDVEDARYNVRNVTGACGTNKTPDSLKEQFALLEKPVIECEIKPFVVPKQYKKALIMSDIHGRFCDEKALYTAVDYGVKHNCDYVILNGDILDFYQLSRFDKSPIILENFWTEREWGQDFLSLLQNTFGSIVYKSGNHEFRREIYIHKISGNCPEVIGLENISDYLTFDNSHVEFVEDYNVINFGKLTILHGHEYQGGGGIHVAYNRLNKAFDNIISGHSHITQSNMKKDINGNFFGSWTTGCLCQLAARYNPRNNWNHGFAVVEVDDSGEFDVSNKLILNGKIF